MVSSPLCLAYSEDRAHFPLGSHGHCLVLRVGHSSQVSALHTILHSLDLNSALS